jgi:hypothetical protein
MNSRLLTPLFLVLVGCSGAETPAPAPSASAPPATTAAAAPSPAGPSVSADVVTIDTAAPSITLRDGDVVARATTRASDIKTGDRTIRVEPSAAASLSGLKPGDRVRVTCSAMQAMMMGPASPAASASAAASPAPPTSGLAACDSVIAITAAPAP